MKTTPLVLCVCSLLSCATFSAFGQGSLTPPGPPASTMKSLDQIEARIPIDSHLSGDADSHFVLDKEGSYYLTANIAATKTNGIHVTVPNVTVDLNGYHVTRMFGQGGAGVLIEPNAARCT